MLILIEIAEQLKALIFFFVPFFCVILCMIGQWAMLMNRKPGVKLFDAAILGNPLAIQFFGRRFLTERGIFWRNVSWVSFSVPLMYILFIL
jgi:hypothetical protein